MGPLMEMIWGWYLTRHLFIVLKGKDMLCWECPKYQDPLNKAHDLGIPGEISKSRLMWKDPPLDAGGNTGPQPLLLCWRSVFPVWSSLTMSRNHVSSSPPNTDIGFSVWYWPLHILGASTSHREHFKMQMPRPSSQILIRYQRFGESAHDPISMILFIQQAGSVHILCARLSALGTGDISVNKKDTNPYLYRVYIC